MNWLYAAFTIAFWVMLVGALVITVWGAVHG